MRLVQQMEALLSWRGVMFLTRKLVCTEARTCGRSAEAQGHLCWSSSQPTCVYPQTDAHKEPLVFPCRRQMNTGVFFHMLSAGILFLPFWCIQLRWLIYFPSHPAVSDLTLWLLYSSTYDSTPRGWGCCYRKDE